MTSIRVVKTMVVATPGSPVGNSVLEAMLLALKEARDVELTHNGNRYLIEPQKMVEEILQQVKA